MFVSEQKAVVIFNKLVVNEIEDSSGIFIGTNQAVAWSSYSKTNQGFGSLKDSTLRNAVNVVQDSDVMDASVKDARWITSAGIPNTRQQCAIDFQSVNVNSVLNGSAIDLGHNKQVGWRTSRKINYGGGKNLGANRISRVANFTFDNDIIDAPFHSEGQIVESGTGNVASDIRITHKKDVIDRDNSD